MNGDQHIHEQLPNAAVERSGAVPGPDASELSRKTAVSAEHEAITAIPAIEFRNVDFSYDEKKVLDDLSFKLAKGEIKIILSGSGGGKSTILKLILGLLKPDAGQIFIDGEEITECEETKLQAVRDKIGMVFQEGALFDSLTVYENVAYRLQDRDVSEEDVEEEVRSLLEFVKLEKEMDKLPSELSGGMRKRVSIARALVGNPKIVLFDEPTVALDPPTSGTICDLIIELRDLENVASIVVTHEMDVVQYLTSEYVSVSEEGKIQFKDEGKKLCLTNTNILMLRNGREIFSGTSKELIESDDPYIQKFIRGTELLPERTETGEQAPEEKGSDYSTVRTWQSK
jgi:phospholipid/cholesterol/gamma-HCH transport system ATP-binding protein